MKVLILLVPCLLGLALSISLSPQWPIPNKDGSISWMTEEEAALKDFKEIMELDSRKSSYIKYFLFTQSNPDIAQEIIAGNLNSVKKSNFNPRYPTRISVHGWGGKWDSSQNMLIKDSFLKNGRQDNLKIIVMDWSFYSDSINYYSAKLKCSVAGEDLGHFLDWMHSSSDLNFSTLFLIGHSLGAHVVGFAGKTVTKGRVQIIYGLDPAMPLFSYINPKNRLAYTDANYVETIQTNGGFKGFYQPIGEASFYPNRGRFQPGCGINIGCAHARAVEYYAEAVLLGPRNNFIPNRCSNFESLIFDECKIHVSGIRMGDPSNYGKANGVYSLKTNSESPFGMGVNGQ